MTTRRWVDWVNVILGMWLIASPWLLTVAAGDRPAGRSSWSVGVGIVTLAFFAMYKPAVWGDAVMHLPHDDGNTRCIADSISAITFPAGSVRGIERVGIVGNLDEHASAIDVTVSALAGPASGVCII